MKALLFTGVLAPLWMALGVAIVASRYPGYKHRSQVMSELGARSRPTSRIHPWVNNYPISILFVAFGIGVYTAMPESLHSQVSGILLITHGICHWITGLFPCDADLGEENPSVSQKVHNGAGLLMYFTLLVACLTWVFPASGVPSWFRVLSLTCAVTSVVFLVYMINAIEGGPRLGLHQRLSLGILGLWTMVFASLFYP